MIGLAPLRSSRQRRKHFADERPKRPWPPEEDEEGRIRKVRTAVAVRKLQIRMARHRRHRRDCDRPIVAVRERRGCHREQHAIRDTFGSKSPGERSAGVDERTARFRTAGLIQRQTS